MYKPKPNSAPGGRAAVELAAFLRYRGIQIPPPEGFCRSSPGLHDGLARLGPYRLPKAPSGPRDHLRAPMSTTFDKVADIIAETCDIPRDTITPESHAIDDLKI